LNDSLAQADALAWGDRLWAMSLSLRTARRRANRPSTLVRLARLDARSVGALLAMYEPAPSFRAWCERQRVRSVGVEIGKQLAARRTRAAAREPHRHRVVKRGKPMQREECAGRVPVAAWHAVLPATKAMPKEMLRWWTNR